MPVAVFVVFLLGIPALGYAQPGPCAPGRVGFDPYKPSDLAVLRQFGGSVLANATLSSLLQLDPYVPTEALLLRQYGGALPLWPTVWYPPYFQTGYPPGCGPVAQLAADASEFAVRLSGNADLRALEPLGRLVSEVHAAACRLRVAKVIVDVRALDFMNSSCLKNFVSWLNGVQALPVEQHYRVHFISEPKQLWQRRTLLALRSFAIGLVTIES